MYQDQYNTHRVHKVNLLLTIILVFLICVPIVSSRGFEEGAIIIVAGLIVLVMSIITFFFTNQYICKRLNHIINSKYSGISTLNFGWIFYY